MLWHETRLCVNVNEKHSRNRERWPARPYSSSGPGVGVVWRHRATAAACVCLTANADAAAAYYTSEGAAHIKSADGFLHNNCPNSSGFTKYFSNMVFYNCGLPFFLTENYFPTVCTTSRSCSVGARRTLRLEIRNEGIFAPCKFWSLSCLSLGSREILAPPLLGCRVYIERSKMLTNYYDTAAERRLQLSS